MNVWGRIGEIFTQWVLPLAAALSRLLISGANAFFGFWAKFVGLTLFYIAIATLVGFAMAVWANARNPQGFRDRMFPQPPAQPQPVVGFAPPQPPPQNPTRRQWFTAIAVNNDWLFWLPLVACLLTGIIASVRPVGEPVLSTAWRETQETQAWNTAEEKAQSAWDYFLHGNRTQEVILERTLQEEREKEEAEKRRGQQGWFRRLFSREGDGQSEYGSWFWWLAFLVYLVYLPLGLFLAFHDEVTEGVRRAVDRFSQRRQPPPAPPQQGRRRGQPQPPPAPGPSRTGILIWEAVLDFFSGFATEYVVHRAFRRRLI